jgi:signal transduction histidine kinase
MTRLQHWRETFPTGPTRFTAYDLLAWLLLCWSLVYAALLPRYPTWNATTQAWFRYSPAISMIGCSIILIAALLTARVHPGYRYRLACATLLLTQVLNLLAVVPTMIPYRYGAATEIATPFYLYVLVYSCLICSIACFVPLQAFPRLLIMRIMLNTSLVMAITDVALRLGLPLLVADWRWNDALLACAFRLETTIGLTIWYAILFRRLADPHTVAVRLWMLGFGCLLINDALVLWATFLLDRGLYAIRAPIPFWMFSQALWALALYRSRASVISWNVEEPSAPTPSLPLWWQALRLALTLAALVVVVAIGPSLSGVIWFVCALVIRELLGLYERERALVAERRTRSELASANTLLTEAQRQLVDLNSALAEANLQLRDVSKRQADLLQQRQVRAAEVAHDMGNTLQNVRLTLTLLRSTAPPPDPATENHLETAEADLNAIDSLLNAMVAAAQLDAGALQLQRPIDTATLLRQVVQQQQLRAEDLGVQLDLVLHEPLPPLQGDPALLARALTNIIGNGLKYTGGLRTDGTGEVRVTASHTDQQIDITVSDNGPGIAPEQLARLGRRFVRGVDGGEAPAGFGLGLAFSRGVIEQHPGGSLTIESSVDVGTAVHIRLPAKEHERAVER